MSLKHVPPIHSTDRENTSVEKPESDMEVNQPHSKHPTALALQAATAARNASEQHFDQHLRFELWGFSWSTDPEGERSESQDGERGREEEGSGVQTKEEGSPALHSSSITSPPHTPQSPVLRLLGAVEVQLPLPYMQLRPPVCSSVPGTVFCDVTLLLLIFVLECSCLCAPPMH